MTLALHITKCHTVLLTTKLLTISFEFLHYMGHECLCQKELEKMLASILINTFLLFCPEESHVPLKDIEGGKKKC